MSEPLGSSAVADDELIYRRIPVSKKWWDPTGKVLEHEAFAPLPHDVDGVSVSRACSPVHPDFHTMEAVGLSVPARQGYYVAVLRVGDLRACGLDVIPDPILPGNPDGMPVNPGHALIPALRYDARQTDQILQWMALLADQLVLEVGGPFVRP